MKGLFAGFQINTPAMYLSLPPCTPSLPPCTYHSRHVPHHSRHVPHHSRHVPHHSRHVPRVCYLARARAMARVVLAQIEFTRAIRGSSKISRCLMLQYYFCIPPVRYMTSLQLDSGLYIAVHYTGHRGHYTDHYIL